MQYYVCLMGLIKKIKAQEVGKEKCLGVTEEKLEVEGRYRFDENILYACI